MIYSSPVSLSPLVLLLECPVLFAFRQRSWEAQLKESPLVTNKIINLIATLR